MEKDKNKKDETPFVWNDVNTLKYQDLLKCLNEIKKHIKDCEVDIPIFVVIGDQSSGKSSLLSCLSRGLQLPQKAGVCTKVPTLINLRNNQTPRILVGIEDQLVNCKDFEEALQKIENNQSKILQDDGLEFSTREIRVVIEGPDQADLDLIDLPGIIQNGREKETINEMIMSYIRKPSALIMLCVENNKDIVTVAGLGMAEEVDPHHKRTIKIFTKCDNFESDERKKQVVQIITNEEENIMGSHAVCCRIDGLNNVNEKVEFDLLAQDFGSLRSGTQKLTIRLSTILLNNIIQNIPQILQQVQKAKFQKEKILEEIGQNEPQDAKVILHEEQTYLKKLHADVEELLKLPTQTFCKKIEDTQKLLTNDWISQHYHSKQLFSPPFMQGYEDFQHCIEDITKWWQPIAEDYKFDILEAIRPLAQNPDSKYEKLQHYIQYKWNEQLKTIISRQIEEKLLEIHKIEKNFVTLNQNIFPDYFKYMSLQKVDQEKNHRTEALILTKFIDSLFNQDQNQMAPQDIQLTKQEILDEVDDFGVEFNCQDIVSRQLEDIQLTFQYNQQAKREELETEIRKQQMLKLISGVQAYFKTMKQYYIDVIFKIVKLTCKTGRETWINESLLYDKDILEQAKEPVRITEQRKFLKIEFGKMTNLEEKLNDLQN